MSLFFWNGTKDTLPLSQSLLVPLRSLTCDTRACRSEPQAALHLAKWQVELNRRREWKDEEEERGGAASKEQSMGYMREACIRPPHVHPSPRTHFSLWSTHWFLRAGRLFAVNGY